MARTFIPVNDPVLSRHWVRRVAPALQKLTREMSTGVSPALENLLFEGPQLSGSVKSDLELFFCRATVLRLSSALHWAGGKRVERVRDRRARFALRLFGVPCFLLVPRTNCHPPFPSHLLFCSWGLSAFKENAILSVPEQGEER